MKQGLQGLASEIDAVRGKATEDMQELARNADAALQRASSVASDLSARVAQAETQQASASLTAEQAQVRSEAALKGTEDVRRDQQIAYACMEAELQVAATKSQATAEHAAAQAAQAIADARSATTSRYPASTPP